MSNEAQTATQDADSATRLPARQAERGSPAHLAPMRGQFGVHEPVYYRSLFFLDTLRPA